MPMFNGISGNYADRKTGEVRNWRGDEVGQMSKQEAASRVRISNGIASVASDEFLTRYGTGREYFGIPAAKVEVRDGLFTAKPKLRFVGQDGKTIPLSAETKAKIERIALEELSERRNGWRGSSRLMADKEYGYHMSNRTSSRDNSTTRLPTTRTGENLIDTRKVSSAKDDTLTGFEQQQAAFPPEGYETKARDPAREGDPSATIHIVKKEI